jgi:hypothetical protein
MGEVCDAPGRAEHYQLTRSDLLYCDIDGERVETEGIQDLKKHLAESRTARGVHTFSVDDGDMIRE